MNVPFPPLLCSRFTTEALEKLKCSDDEMLRGVDWAAVEQFVDLSDALPQFSEEEPQLQRTQDRSQQTATHATREREQQPGVRRPEAAPVDPKAMEAQQPSPHAPALPTVRTKVPSESSRSTYRPSPGLQSPHQSCPRMLGFRRVGVSEKWERAVQSPRAGPGGVDLDTPKHRLRLLSRRVHFADEEESSQGGTAFDPGVVDIEAPLLEEDGAREEAGREEHSAALFANGGQRVHDHHQLAPLPLAAFPSSTSLYSMASEAGLNFNQDSGAPSSGPYLAESSSTQGRLSTAVPATREVLQPTDVEGAEAPELPERWAEEGLGAPLGAVADQAQHHWGAGDSSHPLGLQVGANGASGWGASGMASSGGGAGGNGAGGSAGLMHHSLSIPLLPEASGAEKMEAQQEQPSQLNTLFPRLPKVLRRFESGGDSQGELLEKPSAGFSVASSLISTPEGSEAAGVWSPEVLAEARRRLLSGLKSYFAAKHADGFLTSEGLRRLAFVCDQAIDTSDAPLVSALDCILHFKTAFFLANW